MESRNRNSEPGMGKERLVPELAIGKYRPLKDDLRGTLVDVWRQRMKRTHAGTGGI
jgi:hypothetical protein